MSTPKFPVKFKPIFKDDDGNVVEKPARGGEDAVAHLDDLV